VLSASGRKQPFGHLANGCFRTKAEIMLDYSRGGCDRLVAKHP